MNFTSVLAHLSLSLLLAFNLAACQQEKTTTGSAAQFDTNSGQTLDFSKTHNSWLVINYWAEWCKPCIEEIPELNALNTMENISVYGINYDGETGEVLQSQLERLGIEFPTILGEISGYFSFEKPNVLPTTVIIDKNNNVVKTLFGPQTKEKLVEVIRQNETP